MPQQTPQENVVGQHRKTSMQLYNVAHGDTRKHLPIPKCISDECGKLWSNFLVGHFIERTLPYSLVQTIVTLC